MNERSDARMLARRMRDRLSLVNRRRDVFDLHGLSGEENTNTSETIIPMSSVSSMMMLTIDMNRSLIHQQHLIFCRTEVRVDIESFYDLLSTHELRERRKRLSRDNLTNQETIGLYLV